MSVCAYMNVIKEVVYFIMHLISISWRRRTRKNGTQKIYKLNMDVYLLLYKSRIMVRATLVYTTIHRVSSRNT